MTTERKLTIRLTEPQAVNAAFLLSESYDKWGMELNHYSKTDDVYPQEAMNFLDLVDDIRDQLVEQGVEWHP
jgi:hypothetical protein